MKPLYFLAILPLVLTIVWQWQNDDIEQKREPKSQGNFNIDGMTSWRFSSQSKTIIRSIHAEYNAHTSQLHLKYPVMQNYRKGQSSIEARSNRGIYHEANSNLALNDNIHIFIKTSSTQIYTDQLSINFSNDIATSSESVKIIGKNFQLEGTGVEFKLENYDLNLLANVRTRIDSE